MYNQTFHFSIAYIIRKKTVTIMPLPWVEEGAADKNGMSRLKIVWSLTMENQKFEIQEHQLPRLLNIHSL